jgi:Rad17 cell cycle checkpoint protein.
MTSTTRATEEEDVVEDVIEDDDDDVLAAIDRRATTTATATTTSSNSARRRAPRDASECATPAKKMAALRAWLDGRGASRALCASGPPGCGKATAIKCVAEEAGYEVREWQAPTPTLWREYSHAKVDGDLGVEYSSKVDDFVAYVERATKYAPLSFLSSKTSCAGGNGFGGERVVLMIRDFPTSDENGRARILEGDEALVDDTERAAVCGRAH